MTEIPVFSLQIITIIFSLTLSSLPIKIISQTPLSDQQILLKIKQEWGNQSVMESWNSHTFHCDWPGIICSNGKIVTGISLNSQNIRGEIPSSVCDLKNLTLLDVGNNNIPGKFPTILYKCTKLQTLVLSSNYFTGILPIDINKLSPKLQHLNISGNRLTGRIPSSIGNFEKLIGFYGSSNLFLGELPIELTALSSLVTLELDWNQLFGQLPSNIISWQSLRYISLAGNNFSGPVPTAFGVLPNLLSLNLSSNKLSGQIPHEFANKSFDVIFSNNPHLCSNMQISNLPHCSSSLPKYVPAIIVPGAIIVLIILYIIFTRVYEGRQHSSEPAWDIRQFHRLDFSEMTIMSGLTERNEIGSGASGKVYKVVNDSGDAVAVKRILNGRKLEETLEKQFLAEINILGTIRHGNVVELLCSVSSAQGELLIYEYMKNHSLDKWLYKKKREKKASSTDSQASITSSDPIIVIDWPTRSRIAIGAAKGLSYLHHDCYPPIIHRDVKSSNILLDKEFNAKIADFGLAKMSVKTGEPYTASIVAGSFGYIAPGNNLLTA
ncbi:unnamed protein product [Amaranthus hypochondriacus]